ncbi:MAG: MarR family transcriptional regulator [Deltaproteobacteria bacterium]|nr:MarR family transcriptional regulator [Deltaproteobacteria bacterium]
MRRVNGDLTGWLEYTAEALHLTLERVLERIARLAAKATSGSIALTPKQERLLHLLRDKGGLAPREIWRQLKITKQGAAKILTKKSGKYSVA